MIKFLLTGLRRAGRENIWLSIIYGAQTERSPISNIKDVRCKLGCQLEYGRHVIIRILLIIVRLRRRRAIPLAHDYHEKSSSTSLPC